METSDLIKALSADTRRPALTLRAAWTIATIAAVAVAAIAFFSALGPRPDFAHVIETVRFPFKFVVTGLLAVTALAALLSLSRPGGSERLRLLLLGVAPLLLAIAVVLELAVVPASDWGQRMIGSNSRICLTAIPLIGLGPLALFILALRNAAPTRPTLAGAVAGLAAGGVAATFYASHCTDDSPLFVVTWYTIAIAVLTVAGAVAGRFFVRW